MRSSFPWHWLLALPVIASVIGGVSMVVLAFGHGDETLPFDTERTGKLTTNQSPSVMRAAARGLHARAHVDAIQGTLELALEGHSEAPSLELHLWHPTQSARDERLRLQRISPGHYRGPMPQAIEGMNFLLSFQPEGWELGGYRSPEHAAIEFVPST